MPKLVTHESPTRGAEALVTAGYSAAGDGGAALYKRVSEQPDHPGQLQTAAGAWWELAEEVATPEMFGAVGDGDADDTAAVQAWFAYGVATKARLAANGQYAVNQTIAPAGRFNLTCGPDFRLLFDKDGTYTAVQRSNGAGSFEDGDKSVAFDIQGCGNSRIQGRFWITCHIPADMKIANRGDIPADLVAITASIRSSAAEISWDTVNIQGFGHAFFQDTMVGVSGNILPYTRMTIRFLFVQFCLEPFVTGASGNGFDDMWVDVVRVARCSGQSYIRATDFNVGSMFYLGLDDVTDREGTITVTGASTSATLTDANPDLAVDDVIVILGGADNKAGGAIAHVTRVDAIDGTSVTLEDAPANSGTLGYLVNPPTLLLNAAEINAVHFYIEGIHAVPIRLETNGIFRARDFKISTGSMSGRVGCAILTTGQAAEVDIGLNHRTLDSAEVRYVVGFGKIRADGEDAAALVRIRGCLTYANLSIDSDVFGCVDLPADLRGAADNRTGFRNTRLNAVLECADGAYQFDGVDGTSVWRSNTLLGVSALRLNAGAVNNKAFNVTGTGGSPSTIMADAEILEGVYLVTIKRSTGSTAGGLALVIRTAAGVSVTSLAASLGSWSLSGSDVRFTPDASGAYNCAYTRLG